MKKKSHATWKAPNDNRITPTKTSYSQPPKTQMSNCPGYFQ